MDPCCVRLGGGTNLQIYVAAQPRETYQASELVVGFPNTCKLPTANWIAHDVEPHNFRAFQAALYQGTDDKVTFEFSQEWMLFLAEL